MIPKLLYRARGLARESGETFIKGETAIDLEELSEGLYLLQVQNKNGGATTIKLIKE